MARSLYVIIMNGNPATGKTHTSYRLKDALKSKGEVRVLSTLDVRKEYNLFDLASEDQREEVYSILIQNVKRTICEMDEGFLIIDGNFNKRIRRNRIYDVIKDYRIIIIRCVVSSLKTIQDRLDLRKRDIHKYENKAALMSLHTMIKDESDDVQSDNIIIDKSASFIQYNTEKSKIETIKKSNSIEDNENLKFILNTLTSTDRQVSYIDEKNNKVA